MGFAKKKGGAAPPPRAAPPPARPAPPPMQQPAPAMAPAAPSSGPGMMGTFGSSMAGSMAGSMIGNAMFGGSSSQAPAPAAVEAPAQGYAPQMAGPVCSFESRQFLQCMTQANDNMDYCRQYYDAFKMCSSQAQY